MRPKGVIAACGLLALLAAAPVSAWPDRRSEGLWERTSWFRSSEEPEKTERRRERRCEASHALDDWDMVFYVPGGKSQAQRATIDRDRVIVERTRVWDRSMRYDLPWMSQDPGRASMWVSRHERSGDPQRRLEHRWQAHRRDVVAGTASKDVVGSVEGGGDLRRLGDCPSDLRFMSLRELWRSIFQWRL